MKDRIIDRDIQFYDDMIAKHETDRRRSYPHHEARHVALRDAALAAVVALVEYRVLMDKGGAQ